MDLSNTIAATLFLITLILTLPACERHGPLEEAGETIDEGIEDTGDAIEDATDGN